MKYPTTTATLALLTLLGCHGSKSIVRPASPTLQDANDSNERPMVSDTQCRAVADYGQPLVVEWEPHHRANLEESLSDGLAVVAYDCKSLRLLRGCHLDGVYGYLPVSRKEEVIQLEDAEEIRANLPGFGGKLASSLGGEMARGTTLDLALVMVGKKRTTRQRATPVELKGTCDGATHFVRGVFLGAFAMATGSKGKIQATAQIFGAGGGGDLKSSKVARHHDGALDACTPGPGTGTPPSGCEAPLRLELTPIDSEQKSAARSNDLVAVQVCPEGMLLQDGKCALPSERPHVCAPGDREDCSRQCGLGDAESCNSLGVLHERGRGGLKVDEVKARLYYDQGCSRGSPFACTNLGYLHEQGRGGLARDDRQATQLYVKGCEGGSVLGCNNLGVMYLNGRGGLAHDPHAALVQFENACGGGLALGCSNLGFMHEKGKGGLTPDTARAVQLYARACEGDDPNGCGNLGYMHEQGLGNLPRDEQRAGALYKRSCDYGGGIGCNNLGAFYEHGRGGLNPDPVRAAALFEQSCQRYGNALGCNNLGRFQEQGLGGLPRDPARALESYRRACTNGSSAGCDNSRRLTP